MESNKNRSTLNNNQNLENNKINYFQDTDTSSIITAMSNDNHLAIESINGKINQKNSIIENRQEKLYNPYDDDYEDPF